MKMKEFQQKSEKELHTLLAELREGVRSMRANALHRELKNVRDIRKNRKDIARIMTVLRSKKTIKKAL